METFNSRIINTPYPGIIQGSKLSSTFYNLYVNEVTDIYKLIYDPLFESITGRKTKLNYKNISHLTINFIDDSSSVISAADHSHLKHYLEDYYELLHEYYNINKLKINPEKNQILLIYKNSLVNVFKNFSFNAKGHIIKKSNTIKLLGTYISADLKMDREINNLSSQLHSRIHSLKQLTPYTDFRTRLIFANSFIIGKLIYMLPLYLHASQVLKNKLHKVLMTAARVVISDFCYKKSCSYILKKCQWLSIKNYIIKSGIIVFYKIVTDNEPVALFELYKKNLKQRSCTKWSTIYKPKTVNMEKYFIYKSINLFYNLPYNLQNAKSTTFNKKLKKYLMNSPDYTFDSCD